MQTETRLRREANRAACFQRRADANRRYRDQYAEDIREIESHFPDGNIPVGEIKNRYEWLKRKHAEAERNMRNALFHAGRS